MQACDFSDPGHGEILGKVLQNIGVDLMDDIVVCVCTVSYTHLLDETKEVVDNRYPCGEGGWIHYRVTDRKQMEDAKLLLRVKLGCLASGAQRRGRK